MSARKSNDMFQSGISEISKWLFILMALFLLSNETAAVIDNCCFVGRQCTTNYDWVSGYYAFQNNHCPAPSQQQPQSTSSQLQSSASEVIDNCCFMSAGSARPTKSGQMVIGLTRTISALGRKTRSHSREQWGPPQKR